MDRLEELRERFGRESKDFGARLKELEIGRAVVECDVHNLFVIADEKIAQGGFFFSIANLAGVYAAMSCIPKGHTKLPTGTINPLNTLLPGDTARAEAQVCYEHKKSNRILVQAKIFRGDELVACGTFEYRKPKS